MGSSTRDALAPGPVSGVLKGLLVLALLTPAGSTARAETCIGEGIRAVDARRLVGEAVEVLRACGHDPADYTVELRLQDPFLARSSGTAPPALAAVFLPRDPRGYAVRVDAQEPCALSWLWDPGRFTPWQRQVLERAVEFARAANATAPFEDPRVSESSTHLGIRWSSAVRLVLDKRTLQPVAPDPRGP